MTQAMMRFRLVNIGRERYTGDVSVTSVGGLMREIGRHCASRGVDICADGAVIAGMTNRIGTVVPLNDAARQALPGAPVTDGGAS